MHILNIFLENILKHIIVGEQNKIKYIYISFIALKIVSIIPANSLHLKKKLSICVDLMMITF